jgi:hypothetical protein
LRKPAKSERTAPPGIGVDWIGQHCHEHKNSSLLPPPGKARLSCLTLKQSFIRAQLLPAFRNALLCALDRLEQQKLLSEELCDYTSDEPQSLFLIESQNIAI